MKNAIIGVSGVAVMEAVQQIDVNEASQVVVALVTVVIQIINFFKNRKK